MNLKERFEKFEDIFLEFEPVEGYPTKRPDLTAFLLIDKLLPGKQDIVGSAEHDEVWLSVEPDEFEKVATDDDISILVRCGVMFDDNAESFSMFV